MINYNKFNKDKRSFFEKDFNKKLKINRNTLKNKIFISNMIKNNKIFWLCIKIFIIFFHYTNTLLITLIWPFEVNFDFE
jgi:hypothetical protein